MIDKKKIPKEILPYLVEIANRLWSGHAAIMIGAGFSKNAKKNSSTKKEFPDWSELGDVFYEKLNGIAPKPKDKSYLNVLKLADEVEAAFGRNTLDQIIKTEIPDMEYQPSILHGKTLELPWSDVFTTNYDTLLERAAENVLQYRYETVLNKEDLIFSTKPRIIKLHGSFPSERPFIITEEDYRKYPIEFAPFVNTVQQSLLENTLCLVGFSGDDPNFLKWIGWIRDNLGKQNSPKIFLIGKLSLTIGQIRLLEDRNIIPIDLSACIEKNGNYSEALTFFVDFLTEQDVIAEKLNWPKNNIFFRSIDENRNSYKEIIDNWRNQRISYPNWLIVPDDRRNTLIIFTEDSYPLIRNISKVPEPYDIELLYEFDWRFKMCLMPIYNNLIEHYEQIIEKYNPYPDIFDMDDAITSNKNTNFKWKNIAQYWLELQISMMRFYREEGFLEKWHTLVVKLKKIINNYSSEHIANFHYEICLYYLFALDISELKKELENWKIDNSLPYWEAKRAGLLAELGKVAEAEKILETSLKTIRDGLYLSPVLNDYKLLSQEGFVLQLLKYIKDSLEWIKREYKSNESLKKEYSDRWNTLIQYKCDPWAEFKMFNTFLENKPNNSKRIENNVGFDIGVASITEHLGEDTYAKKSYMFLRYIEEVGMPIRIPGITFGSKASQNAITYISNYSPYWAFASYMRLGNTKGIENIFGRKALSKLTQKIVNQFIENYLEILNKSKTEIKKGDVFHNQNFAISLSTVIPEVLSRLCVKSSYAINIKLLDFLEFVFNSDFRNRYKGIRNLSKRLIQSFSLKEQLQVIPKLIKFPIIPENGSFGENEFMDPIKFLNRDITGLTQEINIDNDEINNLLEHTKKTIDERSVAVSRLIKLYELNLLNRKQSELLGEAIWSQLEEDNGFPKGTNYLYFAFLKFPYPKSIAPQELLRDYIFKSEIPVQKKEKEKGISMTQGDIPILYNILGTTNIDIDFTWTKKDLNTLIGKLVEWWDSDKYYLVNEVSKGPFGSTQDEFIARFKKLKAILTFIIAPNIELLTKKDKDNIIRIVQEIPNYGMHSLEVEVAFFKNINEEIIKNKLIDNLFSYSGLIVENALDGVLEYLKGGGENPEPFVSAVCDNIKCLNEINLTEFLTVADIIVREHEKVLTENHLDNIKIGLRNLMHKTNLESDDTNETIGYKLKLKLNSAKLSITLKKYYTKKREKVPDYILKWKDHCLHEDEFSDIRRIWKDE